MIINGKALLKAAPIVDMETSKKTLHGVSYGLSEAGYDIRLKQDVRFCPGGTGGIVVDNVWKTLKLGKFFLGSSLEEFNVPKNLVGIVHDKSTWARKGLSVFNTVIEPGFRGGLTLELIYHGTEELHIPAGAGIAQVIFSKLTQEAEYSGKYQNQSTDPEPARFS